MRCYDFLSKNLQQIRDEKKLLLLKMQEISCKLKDATGKSNTKKRKQAVNKVNQVTGEPMIKKKTQKVLKSNTSIIQVKNKTQQVKIKENEAGAYPAQSSKK